EQLRAAADDHQQIVEIVRDATGQFSDRFHFLRHGKLFTRFDQLLLRVAPLRCVADNAGEAEKIGIVVTDCCEYPGHEKGRAIFPDPPALHFMPALLHSQFQRAVRYAGAPLVGPVKDAEMFADDLLRRVTDYFLGGTVPARHMARRIKDKDSALRNPPTKHFNTPFSTIYHS